MLKVKCKVKSEKYKMEKKKKAKNSEQPALSTD